MKEVRLTAVSAQASTASDDASSDVESRILRRIAVLEIWLQSGLPIGLDSLPNSLRQARDWESPTHGIRRIPSPNDFTTTHAKWGTNVLRIQRLLKELQSRQRPPAKKPSSDSVAASIRRKRDELRQVLAQVVSQWHTADELNRQLELRIAHNAALVKDMQEQLSACELAAAEKDKELSTLRRALSEVQSVRRLPTR